MRCPVRIERTGLRTIAVGAADTTSLALPYLPANADIRSGDLLVTSGLGGVFPEGYPVARVTEVHRDAVQPLAQVRARAAGAPRFRQRGDAGVVPRGSSGSARRDHPRSAQERQRGAAAAGSEAACGGAGFESDAGPGARPREHPAAGAGLDPRQRAAAGARQGAAVNVDSRGRMLLTALMALILTVLPLPPWLDILRPAFLVLMVLYWSVNAPRTGGIALGFFAGLALDVFQGPVLGEHALALALVCYIAVREHQRIRSKPAFQQALIVFAALIVYEFVVFAIDGWTGHPVTSPVRWVHTVTGALVWPPAAAILAYGAGRRP